MSTDEMKRRVMEELAKTPAQKKDEMEKRAEEMEKRKWKTRRKG